MSDPRVDGDIDGPLPSAETGLLEIPALTQVDGLLWGLYYSIYYGGEDTFMALPDSVVKAFGRVKRTLDV